MKEFGPPGEHVPGAPLGSANGSVPPLPPTSRRRIYPADDKEIMPHPRKNRQDNRKGTARFKCFYPYHTVGKIQKLL